MIGSVAASGAGLDAYSAQSVASASSGSGQADGIQMTPQEAGMGDLTAADWKLVSAAVGKDVGPNASGQVSGLQSIFAASIEQARQLGNLPAGQELTVGDLQGWAADQPASFAEQVQNAISYLKQDPAGMLDSAVNITA